MRSFGFFRLPEQSKIVYNGNGQHIGGDDDMLKKYELRFEVWGFLLSLMMIPNFIWFAIPAPNDI